MMKYYHIDKIRRVSEIAEVYIYSFYSILLMCNKKQFSCDYIQITNDEYMTLANRLYLCQSVVSHHANISWASLIYKEVGIFENT